MASPASPRRDAFAGLLRRLEEMELHPDDRERMKHLARLADRRLGYSGPLDRELVAQGVALLAEMLSHQGKELRTRTRLLSELRRLFSDYRVSDLLTKVEERRRTAGKGRKPVPRAGQAQDSGEPEDLEQDDGPMHLGAEREQDQDDSAA